MYSNYYLQCNNKKDLINFMNELYCQYINTGLNNKKYGLITISISNLYNIYDMEEINVYGKMYNILVIPAYKIILNDFTELSIIRPNDWALEYILKFQKEMSLRNILISKQLTEINKPINLKRIMKELSKRLDEVSCIDICNELKYLYSEYYDDNIINIYNKVVKYIYEKFPVPKQDINDIKDMLNDNTCILLNPNKGMEVLEYEFIKYVIINQDISKEIHDKIKESGKEPLYGTGEYI